MASLLRPVGLGLGPHGPVRDAVRAAQAAQQAGLDSVWLHETYFERDAVSYAAAVAAAVPEIRIGLGALNPATRHPVLLAMTLSALDDLAPGRMVLALGSALPLRLAQLGLPYDPAEALARIERTLRELPRLWAGERLAAGTPGAPDIEPMFPPVGRVPLWVAGYRQAFHELAGRAADGYLARPAESLPAVRLAHQRISAAATAAGRPPGAVQLGGYLLCLVDESRRAALDRAKREPFVIYMLSVQSDIALRRAGLDPAIRPGIAAAWRAEDYHGAAALIPDELVDAFLLCGPKDHLVTRTDEYTQAGMTLPILQPVVQTDAQIEAVLAAARCYGGTVGGRRERPAADGGEPVGAAAATAVTALPLRRRLLALGEIARPFSLTASAVPVAAAGALAAAGHRLSWPLLACAFVAAVLLQVGTNVVNEVYDVRTGVDSITSPRASQALVTGRVGERDALRFSVAVFGLATALGAVLIAVRGAPMAVLGLVGLASGWGYTAPPLQYKYRALGLPLVFLLMGPLMVIGGYYAITGRWSGAAAAVSIPIGLLVTAILHGNEWRDIGEDSRAGISTLSIRTGRARAHWIYVALLVGAYMALALAVAAGVLPTLSLLAVLSLPLLVRTLRASELGAAGQQHAIARLDQQTAQLHAGFGALLIVGLGASAFWHP